MVDLDEQEKAAIHAALKQVAEIMEEIGWDKRLCDLTEAQVLTVLKAAIGNFQDAMHLMHALAPDAEAEPPF